jgi:hypothetical protein
MKGFPKNVPVRILGTRFTNAISSFVPGPQEPYRDTLNLIRSGMNKTVFNHGKSSQEIDNFAKNSKTTDCK